MRISLLGGLWIGVVLGSNNLVAGETVTDSNNNDNHNNNVRVGGQLRNLKHVVARHSKDKPAHHKNHNRDNTPAHDSDEGAPQQKQTAHHKQKRPSHHQGTAGHQRNKDAAVTGSADSGPASHGNGRHPHKAASLRKPSKQEEDTDSTTAAQEGQTRGIPIPKDPADVAAQDLGPGAVAGGTDETTPEATEPDAAQDGAAAAADESAPQDEDSAQQEEAAVDESAPQEEDAAEVDASQQDGAATAADESAPQDGGDATQPETVQDDSTAAADETAPQDAATEPESIPQAYNYVTMDKAPRTHDDKATASATTEAADDETTAQDALDATEPETIEQDATATAADESPTQDVADATEPDTAQDDGAEAAADEPQGAATKPETLPQSYSYVTMDKAPRVHDDATASAPQDTTDATEQETVQEDVTETVTDETVPEEVDATEPETAQQDGADKAADETVPEEAGATEPETARQDGPEAASDGEVPQDAAGADETPQGYYDVEPAPDLLFDEDNILNCTNSSVVIYLEYEADAWAYSENAIYLFDTDTPTWDYIWSYEVGSFAQGNYTGAACVEPDSCNEFYFFDTLGDGILSGGLTLYVDGIEALSVYPGDVGSTFQGDEYWGVAFGICDIE